jgi:hypothetical protein
MHLVCSISQRGLVASDWVATQQILASWLTDVHQDKVAFSHLQPWKTSESSAAFLI